MTGLPYILLLALMPAAGNFVGGLIAEFTTTTKRTLSLALHFAAGIIFAVIALELAPRAFEGAPVWMAALALFVGGLFYILLEAVVERFVGGHDDKMPASLAETGSSSSWMIYAAVAVDLFADGLLIGTSSTLSLGLALVVALGQVTADLPEGFATVANFKDKGVPRTKRLLLTASLAFPILFGALLSYFVLKDLGPTIQLTALAFVAGLLLVAASEELMGEAHDSTEDTRWSIVALVAGFVLFGLVSGYFEPPG